MGHVVLDLWDDLSNHDDMANIHLDWRIVDDTAAAMEVAAPARMKWRQRGVPSKWRIAIATALLERGVPVALSDFDKLQLNPGRIAA